MDLFDIVHALNHSALGWGAIVIFILSIVQIAPIKINPWSWIAKNIGKAINGDMCNQMGQRIDKIDESIINVESKMQNLEMKLDNMDDKEDEYKAVRARDKILDFNDELLNDVKHSKESFDRMLEKADLYERYCRQNPDFQNNKSVMAIENLKQKYKERLEKHDFL